MRRPDPRAVVTILAVAVVMLLFPVSATAAGISARSAYFDLEAGNGYRVSVSADIGGSVEIVAVRGSRTGVSAASYVLASPRIATRHRIVADFGKLGEIDVRYRPRKGRQACGAPTGVFQGVIRFRGEHGYTGVSARRAPGFLSPYACHGFRAPAVGRAGPEAAPVRPADLPKVTRLDACRPARGLAYLALASSGDRFHLALAIESTKRLEIVRQLQYIGIGPGSFDFDVGLTSASARPWGPFAGSATYGAGYLTGDLTAEMPGLEQPVHLTPSKAGLRRSGPITAECERILGR